MATVRDGEEFVVDEVDVVVVEVEARVILDVALTLVDDFVVVNVQVESQRLGLRGSQSFAPMRTGMQREGKRRAILMVVCECSDVLRRDEEDCQISVASWRRHRQSIIYHSQVVIVRFA